MNVVAFPTRDHIVSETNLVSRGPGPEEGLRLVSAFMKIEDAELREQLIRLAERFATHRP